MPASHYGCALRFVKEAEVAGPLRAPGIRLSYFGGSEIPCRVKRDAAAHGLKLQAGGLVASGGGSRPVTE
jgi:hypothetical protein